jgi:nucleotide-binding universal stress UspA family protein
MASGRILTQATSESTRRETMSHSIVCGLDDASGSRQAASIAARLARDLDSRALLVRVTEPPGFLRGLPPITLGRSRRTRRNLKAVAEELGFPDSTGIRVKTGDAADVLMAIAEREDAELVVVAAGGQSTVSQALLGSVSSTLVRDAPCPVVVVPSDAVAPLDAAGMRSVVCGVAGEEADGAVLRLADDLAHRLGGYLHAVHAYDPRAMHAAVPAAPGPPLDADLREAAERTLVLALEEAGVAAPGSVLPLPAADALERIAQQEHAALIVVGSRGRGKLGSLLHGSVPTQLAAQGRTAVVALPLDTQLEPGSGHYELVAGAA